VKLLIDAGNCRVKWAVARGGGAGLDAALDLGDTVTIGAELESELTAAWAALERPAAVWAACVAGPAVAQAIAFACRGWGLRPAFIEAQARQAGVVNSYPRPGELGGDRWAALVAARAMRPGEAAVVVDAGSAVTVDALDAAGVFRGGVILPGARALLDALRRRTANLGDGERGAGDGAGGGPGDGDDDGDGDGAGDSVAGVATIASTVASALATDTGAAVNAGAWLALAAGVDRAIAAQRAALQANGGGGDTPALITGGDAAGLAPLLNTRTEAAPALVLRGVAMLAAAACAAR